MNLVKTGELLARIQVHDNRRVDAIVIEEWHQLLEHVEFDDALATVREHRATSTDYLQVGHVIAGARRRIAARRTGVDNGQVPDADPDDVRAWLTALRTGTYRSTADEVTRALPSFRSITRGVS